MVDKKLILGGAAVTAAFLFLKGKDGNGEDSGWAGSGSSGSGEEGDTPEVFKKDVVEDAAPQYIFNFPDMPEAKKGMDVSQIDQWFEDTYKEYDVLPASRTSSEAYGTPQGYGKHGSYKKSDGGRSRSNLSKKTSERNLRMSSVKKDSGYVKKADTQKAVESVYKKGGRKTSWF